MKSRIYFIHIICWLLMLASPFFFVEHRESTILIIGRYFRFISIPFSFMFAFYTDYFYLIPYKLFCDKQKSFYLYNILIIITAASFTLLWTQLTYRVFPIVRIEEFHHPGPPVWTHYFQYILSLILFIGLSIAIRMTQRWNETENIRREAEKNKVESELKNLRNQINPHFLLNTLNNIYALIAFNTSKAQIVVEELSKLLRYVLYDNQQDFVPLCKEADFLRNYIDLMRIRISNTVNIETRIDIKPDSKTLIAPLIFISLIENAFKHGISPSQPSYIKIYITEEKNKIICDIRNSNYPKKHTDKSGSGIGLKQVSKRLELMYPGYYMWERQVSLDQKEYLSKIIIYL